MITKSMYGLSVATVFAVTFAVGLAGQIPFAAAEEWKISNGFSASNYFGAAPTQETPAIGTINAVTKSGTAVNLALSEFNGFAANNYFGIGSSQAQELSNSNDDFKAFAVQMSVDSPTNQQSTSIKSSTSVDLSLSTWNGFKADNFFGTGLN